jgi:outer membrane protein OmpA-like peptidoglycan-associated protein
MKRIGVLGILLALCVSTVSFSQDGRTDELIGKVFVLYYPPDSSNFSGLSWELQNKNIQTIDTLVQILTENPSLRLRIIGYANAVLNTAKEESQTLLPLSRQRATEAADILTFYGIPKWRLVVSGLGGKYPLAPKWYADEQYRNRRVEFTIIR